MIISDQGVCYENYLLIIIINVHSFFTDFVVSGNTVLIEPPLNLALIQWYDFKSQTRPYMYGYPHIKLKELYNFVVIEAIQDTVHIVPRFDKTNEYFVNKFIF